MKKITSIGDSLNGEDFTANDKGYIILNFQGVTIHNFVINGNVNRSVMENYNTSGTDAATQREDTDGEIPEALRTEEAEALWDKLREAGFIVADGYALAEGVSANQATYIASYMSEKLHIKNKWKCFQRLWDIANMAQLAKAWQQTGKLPPRSREIDRLMK